MKKISYGQMIMILFLCRVFKIMSYNPFSDANGATIMIAMAISTLIQAVMIIPFVWIYIKHPGRSVCELAFNHSKAFGYAVSILYTLYFIMISLRDIRYFAFFMSEAFPSVQSGIFIVISIAIVAGYGALLGIEALGRSSTLVFVGFVIMIISMILALEGHINYLNLNLVADDTTKKIIVIAYKGIGLNTELSAIAILLPKIDKSFAKGAYIFLGLKLIVIDLIVFLYTTILGNYVKSIALPFFTVGAYSKTSFFERFDALYMVEWTFCAVVSIAVFISLASLCVENIFARYKTQYIKLAVTVGTVAITVPFALHLNFADNFYDEHLATPILILMVTIIPLFIAFLSRKSIIKKPG